MTTATPADTGRAVIIRAADSFYAFVDGWRGTLAEIVGSMGRVEVPNKHVESGKLEFFVPLEQLEIEQ